MTVDSRMLATRIAGGDPSAFRLIVERTQAPLYRLASRILGDLSDAEDALQEGYLKAYRALSAGRYDGRAKLETWLYRIVANTCVDWLRRRRERPADPKHEPRFDGEVSAEARVALRQLDGWLGELPPGQRAALVLSAIEGLGNAEIAEILDCSEGAVEQRLCRARTALRARREAQE